MHPTWTLKTDLVSGLLQGMAHTILVQLEPQTQFEAPLTTRGITDWKVEV
jgi:hypothetical protein